MTEKGDIRREDLKSRLIEAARRRIEAGGLKGLRARDVTTDAGCALGGLYTVFGDLDDLVVHVNSDTLRRLGSALEAASDGIADPGERLKALALAYLAFARAHHALWVALFDTTMLADTEIPEWHRNEQDVLIRFIATPLSEVAPDLGPDALASRARTLFAAVHGIVAISLERRFTGLSDSNLEAELTRFVRIVVTASRTPATP